MFLSLFVCQQIIQNVFDELMLIHSGMHETRGNDLSLLKTHFIYDLRKYYFSNKVVDIWNSLPNRVVTAKDTNNFTRRLDTWHNQEIIYDFRAQLQGTRSRSEVSRYE